MKYKIKKTNLQKLKKYIDANTRIETNGKSKGIYAEVHRKND
jgi:hypothetical protein